MESDLYSDSSEISDSSDECEQTTEHRLGACEVCGATKARYTCPKCEVKTCCLKCVNIHKKELECDGIRDKTKFIHMQKYSNTDLLSDYRLLEECARFVESRKRDKNKRFTRIEKELPIHLYKLKMAARKRGSALQFLAQNFTRHSTNTTRYDWKSDVISWRVEWLFPNADPAAVKFADERCSEKTRLSTLLDKYLNPDALKFEGSNALCYYHAAGFNGVKVLLKAEKVRNSSNKYYELDPSTTLGENLAGKCIIEYPLICVVLVDHSYNLELVKSDDEFDFEDLKEPEKVETEIKKESDEKQTKDENMNVTKIETKSSLFPNENLEKFSADNKRRRPYHKVERQLITEKYTNKKKMELAKEIRDEKKSKPKNLLFTTGYSSEENLSESDEDENISPVKKMKELTVKST